jgi:putative nucleotidyltransferase with HDIG domain
VVEEQADGLVVTDLNASNGTFVNGQRIKRQPLRQGDEVEIGAVKLAVEEAPQRRPHGLSCLFTDRGLAEEHVVRRPRAAETTLFAAGRQEPGAPPEPRVQRHLAALYKVNSAIDPEVRPARLMAVVMDAVLEVIRAERGFFLLSDEETGELRPRVVRVAPGSSADPQLPVSRAVVRQCVERRLAILCRDLMADERYREGDRLAMDHIRSVLCAPLDAGGRVVGALYLDTASEGAAFDEQDLELLGAIARQAGLALHRAELIEDLERLSVGAIEMLVATVEAKDIYTYGHSARVSKLARRVAERMGLDERQQEKIKIAALLHDIGKIGIPEAILGKPGDLTEDELAYVHSHPGIGESIIRQMGSKRVADLCPLVRSHHERLDGSGYPDGLAAGAIPLGARILAVADAYDAMTSNRPYRAPFTSDAAIAELRSHAGIEYDVRAVEALVALRGEQRPPTAVEGI